jgi:hypothetical protein
MTKEEGKRHGAIVRKHPVVWKELSTEHAELFRTFEGPQEGRPQALRPFGANNP